jgi:predicted small integral membrane protein
MRYFFSILFIILGFLLVKYSGKIVQNLGSIQFAEQHLHSVGGSRLFIKLLGIAIILVSFLVVSGLIEPILGGIFSPVGNIQQDL